ncbi:hypothetical protein OEZ85_000287 [Tetradesmus obliquus]|uniref:Uncharacterized protein n=1 Tax=Tetradesmus obliquus TaxID=3088 RepID=A0ABY8UQ58_TETOB|nr:hypothetical protein OEZ85_000287 [Tetradesmus obliquus]
MHRLDTLLDHGFGLVRTFESCVQPRAFYRFAPPKNVDLHGKVAVVTGGSSGVAKEVCKELASRGATVYAGCRRRALQQLLSWAAPHGSALQQLDLGQAQGSSAAAVMGGAARLSPAGVVASASVDAPRPNPDVGAVHALHLDLADLNSVEAFAGRVQDAAGKVDLMVLCAAIAGKPYTLSPQGFELHYAVNFLGHFALTQHLLPTLLEQRARVVVVSSILHTYVDDAGPGWSYPSFESVGKRVWWADLPGLAGGWWAYCRSNLAKTWFGYELQRRHPELTVPVVHPGVIDSGLTVVPAGLQTIKSVLLARPEDVKGHTFYHNTLGIIPSSSASYDITRSVPHYDAALKMMHAHKQGSSAAQEGRQYSANGSGNGNGRSSSSM